MKQVKKWIKRILILFNLHLTQNMKYDRDTEQIIAKLAKEGKIKNGVDVGVLDGEILELFLEYLPKGRHFGIEPLPHKFETLKQRFGSEVQLLNYALGKEDTTTSFNFVKTNPSYSGLKERKYPKQEQIEKIEVAVRRLDGLLPDEKIDLIKIDVEGAELDVLKGAETILKKEKPYLIFECGLGAAEYYGTTPEEVFDFLGKLGYQIFLMADWLKEKESVDRATFIEIFKQNKEYYFLAEYN